MQPLYSLRKNDFEFKKGSVEATLKMSDVYKPPQHFDNVSHCSSMEQVSFKGLISLIQLAKLNNAPNYIPYFLELADIL